MLPAPTPCLAIGILVQCRPGFEPDASLELQAAARTARLEGSIADGGNSGFTLFQLSTPTPHDELRRRFDLSRLIFSRQGCQLVGSLDNLPEKDRLSPLMSAITALGERFSALLLETPDTNDGKSLASLLRPLAPHLRRALANAGVAVDDARAPERLHVFFLGGAACHVGLSRVARSSPWPMGIPRLRMPAGAPSRSTLKLAEALLFFLGEEGTRKRLRPGMTAVDLGASPGGWTWQLVRHGLMVTAVDNGPMDAALLETGQVRHRREDGFRFRPAEPVDWLVCDMVESPSRVAALAAGWVAGGWCREAIFNLKLPMKKRREEVERTRGIVAEAFAGRPFRLAVRHLYHDREEVTAWLAAGPR